MCARECVLWRQVELDLNSAFYLTGQVNLEKIFRLSEPYFHSLKNGNQIYLKE